MTASTTPDFDRLVSAWLEADGPREMPAAVVSSSFERARRVRQRGAVRAALSGSAPWPGRGWRMAASARHGLKLAVVGLLMVALLGGALLAGARLLQRQSRLTGVIEQAGPTVEPLYFAHGTALPDGEVLVTGSATSTNPIAPGRLAAELFDPATGAFRQAAPFDIGALGGHVDEQVGLADGRVLILGAYVTGVREDGGSTQASFARIYDSRTGTFATAAPHPDSVPLPEGPVNVDVLDDGRVRFESPQVRAAFETGFGPQDAVGWGSSVLFDPATDSWGVGDPAITPPLASLTGTGVRLQDGRILFFGRSDRGAYVATYDPRTGIVTELPENDFIEAGGQDQAVTLSDGRVLIYAARAVLFDPRSDHFVDVDAPIQGIIGTLPDGRLLLDGFEGSPALAVHPVHRLWFYDPVADRFSPWTDQAPETCCANLVGLSDGRVLALSTPNDGPVSAWLMH